MSRLFDKESLKNSFTNRTFKAGGFTAAAALIFIVICILINVAAAAVPDRYMRLDMSSNRLFTFSEQTKDLLDGLDRDVDIYWIVREGKEDETLGLLLDRYDSASSHVTVTRKDPDVFPGFLKTYNVNAQDNSLIVDNGERFRYITNDDLFTYDYSSYYTDGTYDVDFNGESEISSAISYCLSAELPRVYTLSGHGETALPESYQRAVAAQNIELQDLSLMTAGDIPEDADAILICAPSKDLSADEAAKLTAYVQAGGDLLLITGPQQDGSRLTNLESVMACYGVTAADGIVVETDRNHYAWDYPYYLLPNINIHDITTPLREAGYYVLLPLAQGLQTEDVLEGANVLRILTTSNAAYAKIKGFNIETFEMEDGDIEGMFGLGVAVEYEPNDTASTHIVWISSEAVIDEQTNEMVSGGNQDLFLNSLSWVCEQEEEHMTIHPKSLSYEYLTMDNGTGAVYSALAIFIIPAVYMIIGIVVWAKRRRR